jgi:hypothetical protein
MGDLSTDGLRVQRQASSKPEYLVTAPDSIAAERVRGANEGFRLYRFAGSASLDVPIPGMLPGEPPRAAHLISRLRMKKDAFTLDDISVEYLKKNPSKLRHNIGGWLKDCAEITATTAELRAFVRENARNDAAWSPNVTYKRAAVMVH